jgi:hypothetical protein
MSMTDVLSRLREENPEIAQILELYEETEHIYQDALKAMGQMPTSMFESRNSAEVTVSLPPSQSLSTDKWGS